MPLFGLKSSIFVPLRIAVYSMFERHESMRDIHWEGRLKDLRRSKMKDHYIESKAFMMSSLRIIHPFFFCFWIYSLSGGSLELEGNDQRSAHL